MLTIISIFLVYITIINALIFLTFLFRKHKRKITEEDTFENLSVVVAFRNEERNLLDLLEALKDQSLPKEKFEVILVDDYSEDQSFELAKEVIKTKSNFKVFKNKYKQGKKNALRTGIEEAKNEILVFTDADCIPHKEWLKLILKYYDRETDIVYGFSPFISRKSFVNQLCRYENFFTSILITAFHNIELPYMSFGRNFSYRKSLFERLGGYREIEKSISGDDDLFFQLAIRNGGKAKLILEPESIVFTKCNDNFFEYLRRKVRHISASKYYSLEIKLSLGLIYFSNILLNLFLIPSILSLDIFLVTFILLNWFIKASMFLKFKNELKLNYPIYLIPFYDFIYFLLLILIGIRSRFRVVHWK